jgi:hypothetical protein
LEEICLDNLPLSDDPLGPKQKEKLQEDLNVAISLSKLERDQEIQFAEAKLAKARAKHIAEQEEKGESFEESF